MRGCYPVLSLLEVLPLVFGLIKLMGPPFRDTCIFLHPGRLTWNIIMEVWKIIFLSKWVICRFHINLPGCSRYSLGEDILRRLWKKPKNHQTCSGGFLPKGSCCSWIYISGLMDKILGF